MVAHECDLSGRNLDALRWSLGFQPVGGESFPDIPMVEWCANIKKDIFFIGAVGDIALSGSRFSTVPPDKAGLVLHFRIVCGASYSSTTTTAYRFIRSCSDQKDTFSFWTILAV